MLFRKHITEGTLRYGAGLATLATVFFRRIYLDLSSGAVLATLFWTHITVGTLRCRFGNLGNGVFSTNIFGFGFWCSVDNAVLDTYHCRYPTVQVWQPWQRCFFDEYIWIWVPVQSWQRCFEHISL